MRWKAMDEAGAISEAAMVFASHGIEFALPWNGDLDDLECERYDALVEACHAYADALKDDVDEQRVINLEGDEFDTLADRIVDEHAADWQRMPGHVAANLRDAIAEHFRRLDAKTALADERIGNLLNDCEAAHKALADLIAVRPENWADDDDPEQAEAWRRAQKVVDAGVEQ